MVVLDEGKNPDKLTSIGPMIAVDSAHFVYFERCNDTTTNGFKRSS